MRSDCRFDLIVLDFDGTLCDSAEVKTEGFYQLYLESHGESIARSVKQYHLANAGVSRFEKFAHIENVLVGQRPTTERINALALHFAEIVEQRVIDAPLFAGVESFLVRWSRRVPLAVASATPTEELNRILSAKRMSQYFSAAVGSPSSKDKIIAEYLERFDVVRDRVLVVGDQPSDFEAARAVGAHFVHFKSQEDLPIRLGELVIHEYSALERFLVHGA